LVIPAIQPWSAAGAEKPMRIFSPDGAAADPLAEPAADPPAAVVPAAALAAAEEVELAELDDEFVQAVRASAPAATMAKA
jgi:hypothetical protein